MAGPIVKLDGFGFDRDEVAMLYHHSFYGTNEEQPLPAGHPPTPTMTAQLKLAAALGEDVPDTALQNVERAVADARGRAARRQAQRAEAQRRVEAQPQAQRNVQDRPQPGAAPAEAQRRAQPPVAQSEPPQPGA